MKIPFKHIRSCLRELDAMGLMDFPIMAPIDEYDPECRLLEEWLEKQVEVSVDALVDELYAIFMKQGEVPRTDKNEKWFNLCARQLLGLTHEGRCPVCGETVFEYSGDYDICPICGWEDDLIVLDDGTFDTGANQLSVFETQLEHWMLTDGRTKDEATAIHRRWRENKEFSKAEYVKMLVTIYVSKFCTINVGTVEDHVEDIIDELNSKKAHG